jgi:hypothetical protein
MIVAGELINLLIPPLKLSDPTTKAISWMDELRTSQLPVVDHGRFMGFIYGDDILDNDWLDKTLNEIHLEAKDCAVQETQHFYEILKVASDYRSELVAVLDEYAVYKGAITIQDTISAFAQTSPIQSPGAVVIISMKSIDYSLSEISRLIESNDTKILSSHISSDLIDPSMLKLTLKLNREEIDRVISTLERFNYNIIGKYQNVGDFDNEKERFDILLKYLEI